MNPPKDNNAPLAQAKAAVNRLFKFRLRSEHEILVKLKEKKFTDAIIEQVILFYKKCGMINDTVFTKGWIASRLNKPLGIRRIRAELKEKGIADETITEEIAKVKPGYDEFEAINNIIQRRMKVYQGLERTKAQRRLEGYLLRRGFSTQAIYTTLKNIK